MSNSEQRPFIGNRRVVDFLQRCIANNNVSHAYIFYGPCQVGKTTLAKRFAQALLCPKNKGLQGCSECVSCQQLSQATHPDHYQLNRLVDTKTEKIKKNIAIEQVRQLQQALSLRTFLNGHKIALIEEADTLSLEAANAILKTLEEPSPNTTLILLANNLTNLPETIISRCQMVKFQPVNQVEIAKQLKRFGANDQQARDLSSVAYGKPGIALDYLRQPQNYDMYQRSVEQLIDISQNELSQKFAWVNAVLSKGSNQSWRQLLHTLTRIFRDLLLIRLGNSQRISHQAQQASLERLALAYSPQHLLRILEDINLARRYLEANVNPKLALENLALSF